MTRRFYHIVCSLGSNALALPFVVVALLVSAPLAAQPDKMMDTLARDITVEQKLDGLVDLSLSFTNEEGESVPLATYFRDNKPVVLTLVYYGCPMLCGQVLEGTTRALKKVDLDIGEDYRVVSVSFDTTESHELAAKKKRTYVRRMNRDSTEQGWAFLTSNDDAVRQLANQVGFKYHYDEASAQFAHSAVIVVLTPTGRVSRYFFGIEYKPLDLELGLTESADETIGSLANQVLLLCFQYDPMTGTYGFGVRTAMFILGGLTFFGIVGFISRSLIGERRRRNTPSEGLPQAT